MSGTLLLNPTLGFTALANSASPENWVLLYETLRMVSTKKNGCSQGNCSSISTLSKRFLSALNFNSKINTFLSKVPPISYTLVKHKQY